MTNHLALPINPEWIIEGNPIATGRVLSCSADKHAFSMEWSCTRGAFWFYYPKEETLWILEGLVTLDKGTRDERCIGPGDHVYFPAGSLATWHVTEPVRKIAFLRKPMPKPFLFVLCAARSVKRLIGR